MKMKFADEMEAKAQPGADSFYGMEGCYEIGFLDGAHAALSSGLVKELVTVVQWVEELYGGCKDLLAAYRAAVEGKCDCGYGRQGHVGQHLSGCPGEEMG